MIKKASILMMSALSVVASCTMEETLIQEEQINQSNRKEITIQASREDDPETRTVLESDGSVWWTPGDAISLFYGSGTDGGSKFTSNATENSKVTNFTGVITAITGGGEISVDETFFWGVYPYRDDVSCDGSSVTMTLPSRQTAVPGTFATDIFPSMGRSQGLIMGFYNVCGGWRFSVTKEGVRKVTLKSNNGELITGKVKVVFDASGIPEVREIIDGSDEVVLECPAGEYFEVGKNYYMILLPTTFSAGFTMTFETYTEEGVYDRTASTTVKRSKFSGITNIDNYLTTPYARKTGNIPIEDANFKAYLVENFDGNGDGEISYEEADLVSVLKLDQRIGRYIKSLEGIEFFPNLDTLVCDTGFASSSTFYVAENEGETLDEVMGQMRDTAISNYNASPRGLTNKLDLSNNLNLRYLYLFGHPMLQGINLSSNKELTYLWCYGSMQTGFSLDLSHNTKLKNLNCQYCYLTGSLDLSNLKELNKIDIRGNAFSDVVLGDLPDLTSFAISSPALLSLDVSACPTLQTIYCYCQYIETLDVSGCPDLRKLYCCAPLGTGGSDRTGYIPYGNLKSLDLTNNSKLEYLNCSGSNLEGVLDVTNCPYLTDVIAYYTNIDELRLGNQTSLKQLYLAGCWNLTSLDLSGCPNLEWISTYACDKLGGIDYTYCPLLETCYAPTAGSNLSNNQALKFIEGGTEFYDQLPYLTGLEEIRTGNFSSLDLSYNTNLKRVTIWNTEDKAEVNLSKLVNLESLDIASYANIEVLDISNNLNLTSFTANGCPALKIVYVAPSQEIEGLTVNRSDSIICPDTQVLIKPDNGGSESTDDEEIEP